MISTIALGVAQAVALFPYNVEAGGHSDFCLDYPLSCTNRTIVPNTCCFNYPGGELLQTQFWDTDPATGPANHWTVHGLWYIQSFPQLSIQSCTAIGLISNHSGLTTAMELTTSTATKPANTRTSAPFSAPTAELPSFHTWRLTGKIKVAMTSLSGSTSGASMARACLLSTPNVTSTTRLRKKS